MKNPEYEDQKEQAEDSAEVSATTTKVYRNALSEAFRKAPSFDEMSPAELLTQAIKWLEELRTTFGSRQVLEGREAWDAHDTFEAIERCIFDRLNQRLIHRCDENGAPIFP